MKIRIEKNKISGAMSILTAVIAVVLHFTAEVPWWAVVLFLAVEAPILHIRFELRKDLPWVWAVLGILVGAVLSVYSVQYLILEPENFIKTTNTKLLLNAMCIAAFYLLMLFISNSVRVACMISHTFFLAFAFIDYFVWQFRQNEFTIGDILGAGTGLSVASKYRFHLNERAGFVLLVGILYLSLMYQVKVRFQVRWQELFSR